MVRLVRWGDPFTGLTSLHSQLDDVFNNLLGSAPSAGSNLPAMDVYTEDDKHLVTEVHAPGFDKDDFEINVSEGVLEIKAEHQDKQEEKDKKRSYMLRQSQTSFYRRIALPKNADGDQVEAHFDNGLLKVVIPFKELPAPKKIQIKSGKKNS